MKLTISKAKASDRSGLDGKLATYLAAGAGLGAASLASEAGAVIVANTTEQPFGINQEVDIDFNSDGQIDFQIDHDRVDLGGAIGELDYLQIDKNDVNGHTNPLDVDPITGFQAQTFPPGATTPNNANESAYAVGVNPLGDYPANLAAGTPIGPDTMFDYQEGDNFGGDGIWIRANRLIDEDATTIDQELGGVAPEDVMVPTNGPNFVGLGGEVGYLGVKMELNSTGEINYGWIGVRIDNEDDATGAVVGWAYNTVPDAPIAAGQVPEPSTIILALVGGLALVGAFMRRKWFGGRS